MKRILDIVNNNKYTIIWTVCYISITWAILYFMFHFNIFNGTQWHKLMHAQLRGFPGFVFGILILAMLPLYVATTTLIIRTKKPLITIPLPKIASKKTPEPETATEAVPASTETAPNIPSDLPDEIRPQFMRAIKHADLFAAYIPKESGKTEEKNPDSTNIPENNSDTATNESTLTSDELPIPDDFDISFDDTFSNMPSFDIPVFSDVNFDNNKDNEDTTGNLNHANEEIINYLKSNNMNFTTTKDIIITDKYAIIAHIDNDFWVADPDNWFATGKTRPSPIVSVIAAANEHKVTPVLYLGAQNILDLETLIPEWESNGIKVITDMSEI